MCETDYVLCLKGTGSYTSLYTFCGNQARLGIEACIAAGGNEYLDCDVNNQRNYYFCMEGRGELLNFETFCQSRLTSCRSR